MCAIDEGERYELYRVETRRAATPHRCNECGDRIEPGTSYRWSTGLLDGDWITHRMCGVCAQAAKWLEIQCGGFLDGNMWEELDQHWDEGYRGYPLDRTGTKDPSGPQLGHLLVRRWR